MGTQNSTFAPEFYFINIMLKSPKFFAKKNLSENSKFMNLLTMGKNLSPATIPTHCILYAEVII